MSTAETIPETNNNEPAEKPKRGRPTGSTAKPKRRNFSAELASIEGRVATALKLLRKVQPSSDLLATAIEILEGDE